MKYNVLIILSTISCFCGIFIFAYFNEFIIIRYPLYTTQEATTEHPVLNRKKELTLYYWNHEKWNKETIELMWSDNLESSLLHLLNSWLTHLYEEHVIHKKVTIQTTLLSPNNGELYISFDRNPLNKEESTYTQLLFIEGLLKTIYKNCTDIKSSVIFLVNHQPFHDIHIDFSHPWPITGFLSN